MPSQLPPATLEGWYALHQMLQIDWPRLNALPAEERAALASEAAVLFAGWAQPERGGWSAAARLAGKDADVLLVHFRPTLEELTEIQLRLRRSRLGGFTRVVYDFLSVTEAGMYHATTQAAAAHEPRSKEYQEALAAEAEAELASTHVQSRLFPRIPEGMEYVSFYPMNKKREGEDNWYSLPIPERNRLMREHGLTGRRYAGRVFQVITGSVGLDDWEWGVTLFARDALEFKRIVTEMRYDEASARYGEFGRFFTGVRFDPEGWRSLLGGE
ncbi:MAG TPA: hydrogen peroxide-dependent heme synthase [Longimicrobiaceae bacterium]|nr:hydrogen peroxide-dependent heme synthase [Longimicrobiaceae bacterium]